ncbi:MAG: arginine--tRNA ligase [Selenomonadaceae bacterium]|nr:arginine--tRNA ligase [Selenomonadaceae bacterium]
MNIREKISSTIKTALESAVSSGKLQSTDQFPAIVLEVPPKKEFGDFASNVAMQSAKIFRKSPRNIAEIIRDEIRDSKLIDRIEIAGPGFMNFYLAENVIYDQLSEIFANLDRIGYLAPKNAGKIQFEYVSANPTGSLHVGHGRGAAVGSALVNLFRAAGFDVESEFYINDAGNQMENLALSVEARYLELLGIAAEFPENGYHGVDIIETAQKIIDRDGRKYLEMNREDRLKIFQDLAYAEKLDQLKTDLADFRVTFDKWFSERTLHPKAVNDAIEILKSNGSIYEKDGALWLKSTDYGDDQDRVVIRDNGVPTYLAADIAYHKNKFERGFAKMINLWGADHHGYIARVKAAMSALGFDSEKLQIILLQMVALYRSGELVKMSKRTGQSITLRELMEEIGIDAARYFFLMRSADAQLDFDLDLAKKQSNENPVFYVQYAHARICSLIRQAAESNLKIDGEIKFNLLKDETEIDLIHKIESFDEEIDRAAEDFAPQRISKYVYDLASNFHSFYNKCRVIGVDEDLAKSRLALAKITQAAIKRGLEIIGVSAPESM